MRKLKFLTRPSSLLSVLMLLMMLGMMSCGPGLLDYHDPENRVESPPITNNYKGDDSSAYLLFFLVMIIIAVSPIIRLGVEKIIVDYKNKKICKFDVFHEFQIEIPQDTDPQKLRIFEFSEATSRFNGKKYAVKLYKAKKEFNATYKECLNFLKKQETLFLGEYGVTLILKFAEVELVDVVKEKKKSYEGFFMLSFAEKNKIIKDSGDKRYVFHSLHIHGSQVDISRLHYWFLRKTLFPGTTLCSFKEIA